MKNYKFVVIYPTYEDVETVSKTLPSIVDECRKTDSVVVVHDSSVNRRDEMWTMLKKMCDSDNEFLILTSSMSMAAARNLCLSTALSLFAPQYICMLEDDHGLHPGAVSALIRAMEIYYGKRSPNGLRYGLFSGCVKCWSEVHKFNPLPKGPHLYPDANNKPFALGGANSCFRCAPTSHWQNVLHGYDLDEYPISNWQTRNVNFRNYHRGFTTLYVRSGEISFCIDRVGQGHTQKPQLRRYDIAYTASDARSKYHGKRTAIPRQTG